MADDKLERLEKAKASVDEIARRKERLSGVLETRKSRVQELEEQARSDFDCEIDEIPDVVEQLNQKAEEALAKAEEVLASAVAPGNDS